MLLQLVADDGAFSATTEVAPTLFSDTNGPVGLTMLFLSAVVLLYVLWRVLVQRPPVELFGVDRKTIQDAWKQIIETSEHGGLMAHKLAIIEADKLLDRVLKSMFIPGETLGERLKAVGYSYPALREVWPAHKLRNQLVHEATFELTSSQARYALRKYEKALKALRVL